MPRTANALSLLTTCRKMGIDPRRYLAREIHDSVGGADPSLEVAAGIARRAVARAQGWLTRTMEGGPHAVEGGARRLSMTLGRALELGYLVREATWSVKHGDHSKPAAAARRFAKHGVDMISDESLEADASILIGGSSD